MKIGGARITIRATHAEDDQDRIWYRTSPRRNVCGRRASDATRWIIPSNTVSSRPVSLRSIFCMRSDRQKSAARVQSINRNHWHSINRQASDVIALNSFKAAVYTARENTPPKPRRHLQPRNAVFSAFYTTGGIRPSRRAAWNRAASKQR